MRSSQCNDCPVVTVPVCVCVVNHCGIVSSTAVIFKRHTTRQSLTSGKTSCSIPSHLVPNWSSALGAYTQRTPPVLSVKRLGLLYFVLWNTFQAGPPSALLRRCTQLHINLTCSGFGPLSIRSFLGLLSCRLVLDVTGSDRVARGWDCFQAALVSIF